MAQISQAASEFPHTGSGPHLQDLEPGHADS